MDPFERRLAAGSFFNQPDRLPDAVLEQDLLAAGAGDDLLR